MPIDNSRQRSLYFLILATLRKYVSQSEDLISARELAKNLTIVENSESWEISTSLQEKKISVTASKVDFKFYPTKDLSSYEVEPSKQNSASAKSVVKFLFKEAGIANLQFPENSNSEGKKKEKFPVFDLNTIEMSMIFITALFLHLRIIPESVVPIIRTILGVYLLVSLVGWRNIQSKVLKFAIPIISFGALSYFAKINLGSNIQLIFVSYFLLIVILNHFFTSRICNWCFTLLTICATALILHTANPNITKGHIGISLIVLSAYFLNLSKALKMRSRIRQVVLLSGILMYLVGLILIVDLSLGGICGVVFIISAALIKQLTSHGDSSTKIFLGVGLVISN